MIWVMKSRMIWAGHVACMEPRRGVYSVLVGKPENMRPLGRHSHKWEDNIKMDLQEVRWEGGAQPALIWLRTGTRGRCLSMW
jgi:hypothetical protein